MENKQTFDFAEFCKIEEKMIEEISDHQSQNYIYMVIQENLSKESIDFTKFTLEDLLDVFEELEGVITDEDTEGNVSLDPQHPYTRVWAMSEKIIKMGKLPKQRPASPYQFI